MDKSTISRVVSSVTEALCNKRNQFIKWPTNANVNKTKADFYDVAGFPNVLGAVDGTHIPIQAPHEDEASYVNRKHYHSINVQAVCDAGGKCKFCCSNFPVKTFVLVLFLSIMFI